MKHLTAFLSLSVLATLLLAGCKDDPDIYADGGVEDARPDDGGAEPDADTAAPDTTITESPADPSNSATASFAFTATEDGGTFECGVDGGALAACTSPHPVTVADGDHTFEVRAVDAAGNVDPSPATHAWRSDTVAPDTTITSGPAALDNSVNVSFEHAASEAGTSECRLDAGTFAPCTSPVSYVGVTDGPHTFEVRAIDLAGNVDASPAAHPWTLDSTSPDTTLVSGPPDVAAQSGATFVFSSADAGVGATFECRLDGASFAACVSPRSYTGLADGSHTFEVRVRDAVGNVDPTPASWSWTIDTTPPETTISTALSGTVANNDPSLAFTATPAGGTFQCRLDGAAYALCTSPRAYVDVADGLHTFSVYACDALGNCDATPDTRTWTVDTTPPETTISTALGGTVASNDPSLAFTATPAGGTFQCRLDGASYAACTSPRTYADVADGLHTFSVYACDAVGNCDATPDTRTWTIDTTAPETTISTALSGTVASNDPSLAFTATPAGGTFQCRLDGAAYALCTSPRAYVDIADGAHTFSVYACDAVGNCDATPDTRAWTVDTAPPDTTISTALSGTVASNDPSLAFTATPAGGTFQCRLDGAAYALCTSPRAYVDVADGAHTFSVYACDTVGNCDATPDTRTWTVDTTPPQTTITTALSGTVASNDPSLAFTATPAGGTFQCRLDGAAYALCTSPRAYVDIADGAHTFSVYACDAVGNCDATPDTRAWTVDTAPPDTTISTALSGTVASNDPSLAFTATPVGGTFQCRLDGAAYALCTSPRAYVDVADGAHTFSVYACDAVDNCDATPDTRTWTVDTTPPDTTISTALSGTVANNDPSLAFTATPAGGTFQCRLDGAAYALCTSPRAYVDVADGAHTFSVYACDAVGNCDQTPDTRTWSVDTTPPDTTITTALSGTVANDDPSIAFTATPAGGTFQCRLDGAAFAACTSPRAYTDIAQGAHTFSVYACDALNNCDQTPATRSWSVDTVGPTVGLTTSVVNPWPVNYADFTFSNDGSAGFAGYQCALDSGGFVACNASHTVTVSYGFVHTLQVRGCDTLGNCGAAQSYTWTPNRGLVVHLPLDGSLRNVTTLGGAHDGSAPATYDLGEIGQALRLNGSEPLVIPRTNRPMSSSSDRGYAIAFWASSQDGGTQRIVDFLGGAGCYLSVNSQQHTLCCQGEGQGEPACTTGGNGIGFQQDLTHVALVSQADSGDVLVYINGVVQSVLTNPGWDYFALSQMDEVMNRASAPARVDDVRMYNRALTDSEVCMQALGIFGPNGCYSIGPGLELHLESQSTSEIRNSGDWGQIAFSETIPSYAAGRIGNAMTTSSPNNFARVRLSAGIAASDVLFSMWFRDGSAATNGVLWDLRCDGQECQGPGGLDISESGANVVVCYLGYIPGAPEGSQACATLAAPVSTWHHLAIRGTQVRDGQTERYITSDLRLYLDGRFTSTLDVATNASVFWFLPGNAYFGSRGTPIPPQLPPVTLDEVEIYDSFISDATICSLALRMWNGSDCI